MEILEKKINKENNLTKLKLSISQEKISKTKYMLFKKNNFNIPGFRKQTMKKDIFNNLCDKNFLFNESINFILTNEMSEIEKKENLFIISEINLEKINEITDKNVILTINFIIKPNIEFLNDYKTIENLKLKNIEISDDELNNAFIKYVDKLLKKVSVNREIQNKDIVNIDFEGYIDNKQFQGGSSKNYELIIGSNTFIPGFEDQLIGHKINDNVDVNVKFPKEYHVDKLKNKDVIFKCKINNIFVKENPIINDEYIKNSSEYNTIEELKINLKNQIFISKKNEYENYFENELLNKIHDIIDPKINIPEILINNELNKIIDNFKNKLFEQKMTFDSYLKNLNIGLDEFKNMFKKDAIKNVKINLALEKIAKLENINISNDEINNFYDNLTKKYNITKEKMKLFVDENSIITSQKINKTIKFLKEIYK